MPRRNNKSRRGGNRRAGAEDQEDDTDADSAAAAGEEELVDGGDDDDDEDGEDGDSDDHPDEDARCDGVNFLVGRLSVLEMGSFKEFTVDAKDPSGPCIVWGIYKEWCVAQTPRLYGSYVGVAWSAANMVSPMPTSGRFRAHA